MLRTRLLFGLITLILLLWAVGAAGLVLLQDAGDRYLKSLSGDYQIIDHAHDVRVITSSLNTSYLVTLGDRSDGVPLDRTLFDSGAGQLREIVGSIRESAESNNAQWLKRVEELEQTLEQFLGEYEPLLAGTLADPEQRSALLKRLGGVTQRLTDLSESISSLAEQRLIAATHAIADESDRDAAFIITLMVLGTVIAALIYHQLLRHLVDPVVGLRESIDEIKRGNFEHSLIQPERKSEFREVVSAFNEMAAELRLRRRETDQTMMRNNLVNRALLSAIPSPVYVLSDSHEIVQLNDAAESLNENLGISPRLPKKVRRLFERCVEGNENLMPDDPREAILFRADEVEHYYLPRIFRFSSSEDGIAGWAILLHDVTRIRWLDDMKTNLLSTVSHETKTPLTGIRMVLHLLLEDGADQLSADQRRMLNSASGDCERLLETLQTLLDLSRAESGTPHLDREPTDFLRLVERSRDLFSGQANSADVSIRIADEGDTKLRVLADPLRLSEVINNLLSNAIKHSPGGGEVEMKLNGSSPDFVRLTVSDGGPGVPDEFEDRIFERFFRAPGQEQEGVGLGLFISREIMRAHEGRIGLSDRNGNQSGSQFFIDVPSA